MIISQYIRVNASMTVCDINPVCMCKLRGSICTYFSLILVGTPPPWRIFHTIVVEITVVTAITMTTIATTTPATTEGVLLEDEQTASVEGGGV